MTRYYISIEFRLYSGLNYTKFAHNISVVFRNWNHPEKQHHAGRISLHEVNALGRGFESRLHDIVFRLILVPQKNTKYYVQI